jgi:hypothetical protein
MVKFQGIKLMKNPLKILSTVLLLSCIFICLFSITVYAFEFGLRDKPEPNEQQNVVVSEPNGDGKYPEKSAPKRKIEFAGHTWLVKYGDKLGPGPNNFSDSPDDVRVDPNGCLHMKIVQRNGKWYCTEIASEKAFGYGTYVLTLASRVDTLDRNIILGFFTWDDFAPQYNFREIDFEFGRWQNLENDVAQFVIQPWEHLGNIYRYDIGYSGHTEMTTHSFTWGPDGIYFASYYGGYSKKPSPDNMIASWYYDGKDNPSPGKENLRINFWLVWGKTPVDGKDAEVVITDFKHISNVSKKPGDINNDDNVDYGDLLLLIDRWAATY